MSSFMPLPGRPRGLLPPTPHSEVLALQIGVAGEQFLDAVSGADLTDDHADRDTHSANASLAAHDRRIPGDAIHLSHVPDPFRLL
jgi:hypothetical protein